jgi:hypothetical protein
MLLIGGGDDVLAPAGFLEDRAASPVNEDSVGNNRILDVPIHFHAPRLAISHTIDSHACGDCEETQTTVRRSSCSMSPSLPSLSAIRQPEYKPLIIDGFQRAAW